MADVPAVMDVTAVLPAAGAPVPAAAPAMSDVAPALAAPAELGAAPAVGGAPEAVAEAAPGTTSDAMVTQLASEMVAASEAPAVDVAASEAPAVDPAVAAAAAAAAAATAATQPSVEDSAPVEAAAAAAAVVAAAEPLREAAAAAAPVAAAAPEAAAVPAAAPAEGDTAAAEAAEAAVQAAAATVAAAAAATAMEESTPAAALPAAPLEGVVAPAQGVAAAPAVAVPAVAAAAPAAAPAAAVPAAAAAPAVASVAPEVIVTPAKSSSRDNPVDITKRTPPPSILPGVVTPGGGGRRTPRVITEHFCDVSVDGTGGSARLSAVCLHCGCTIRGSVAVTSNFIKHMERRHQAAHAAFLEAGGVKTKRVRRSSGASPGEPKKARGRPPAGDAAKSASAQERAARASLGGSSGFGAGDTMADDGADMDTGMGYPAPSLSASHVNVLGMDTVLPSITCSRVRGVLAKQMSPLVSAHGVAAATAAHSVALKCDGALPGGRTQFRALVSLFSSAAASAAALAEAAAGPDGMSPTPMSPHTPSATAAGLPLVPRGAGRKPVTVFAGATLGAEAAAAAAALRLPCTVVLPTMVETEAERSGSAGGNTRTTVVDAKTTRLAQVRAAGATILFRGLSDDAADAAADVLASASATPAVLADLSLPVSAAGQMNLMGDREKHLVGGYATAVLEALTEGAGDDADVDVVYVPARVACVVAAASVMRAVLPKASLVAVEVVVDKAAKAAAAQNGSVYAYPIDEEEAEPDMSSRPSSAGGFDGAPSNVGGGRAERFGSLSTVEREFVDSLVSRIIRVTPDQAVSAAASVATAGCGACADAPGAAALAGVLTDDPMYVRGQRVLAWITSAVDFVAAVTPVDTAATAAATASAPAAAAAPTGPSGVTLAVSVDGADQPSVLSQLLHRMRACGVVTSFRFARSSAILATLSPTPGVAVEGPDGVLERLRRYGYVTADVSASRLITAAPPATAEGETAAAAAPPAPAPGVVDGFIGALPLAGPGEVVCLYRFERDQAAAGASATDGAVRQLEEVLGEMRVGWKVVLAGGSGPSGALVGFVVLATEQEVVAQWATEHGRGGVDESDNPASAVLRGSG